MVLSQDALARAQVVMSDDLGVQSYGAKCQEMALGLYRSLWVCVEENGFHMPYGGRATTLGIICLEMARHMNANHAPAPAE